MSNLVSLRDGSTVAQELLSRTTLTLQRLQTSNLTAFFELIKVCDNPHHKFLISMSENPEAILKDWRLLGTDHRVDNDVRKIILNSIEDRNEEGDIVSLELVNPVASSVAPIRNAQPIHTSLECLFSAIDVIAVVGVGTGYLNLFR